MANGGGSAMAAGVTLSGPGGRFIATTALTEKEEAWARAFVVNGGNASEAARAAGYASPRQAGWDCHRNRLVMKLVDDLRNEEALTVIRDILHGSESEETKLKAGRIVLEVGGRVGSGRTKDDSDTGKLPIGAMGEAQLAAFIETERKALADIERLLLPPTIEGEVVEATGQATNADGTFGTSASVAATSEEASTV